MIMEYGWWRKNKLSRLFMKELADYKYNLIN